MPDEIVYPSTQRRPMRVQMRDGIRINGMRRAVIDTLRLGGKTYYLLDRLSSRGRFLAFDFEAGPRGNYRAIHAVPRSHQALQYVRVLERRSQSNCNVPTILSYHVIGNCIYLVLPWVRGRTLRQYLDDSRKPRARGLGIFEANRLMRGFAHGLTQLSHRNNMVHGDLKPENLIICREPNRLVAIDFGSAWVVERTANRSEGDGLTGPYAAPEVLRRESFVDFRSDVFSASVIYFEMLTLELPYDGAGSLASLPQFSDNRATLVPPSVLCRQRDLLPRSVWARIDEVVLKGMALDRNERFPTRREWLSALDDIKFEIEKASRFEDASPSSPRKWFWRWLFS